MKKILGYDLMLNFELCSNLFCLAFLIKQDYDMKTDIVRIQ